jgi:hypothetical protein
MRVLQAGRARPRRRARFMVERAPGALYKRWRGEGDDSVPGAQERMESSAAGRAVITAFLVFTLLAVVFTNMPVSELRDQQAKVTGPYLLATGLDQDWGVFAPDPYRSTFGVSARVTYADGSTATWNFPRSNAFFGEYWDYRWIKLEEMLTRAEHADVRTTFAKWVARQVPDRGQPATRVDLIRRFRDLNPPGAGLPSTSGLKTATLFTLYDRDFAVKRSVRP